MADKTWSLSDMYDSAGDMNKSISGRKVEYGMKRVLIDKFITTNVTVTSTTTLGDDTDVYAYDIGAGATNMVITMGMAVIATAGQEVQYRVAMDDIDIHRPIYLTPVFYHTTADTDNVIIKMRWGAGPGTNWNWNTMTMTAGKEVTWGTAVALPEVVCTATTNTYHYCIPGTDTGIIAADTLSDVPEYSFGLEVDALGGASASEVMVKGFWLTYYPRGGSYQTD